MSDDNVIAQDIGVTEKLCYHLSNPSYLQLVDFIDRELSPKIKSGEFKSDSVPILRSILEISLPRYGSHPPKSQKAVLKFIRQIYTYSDESEKPKLLQLLKSAIQNAMKGSNKRSSSAPVVPTGTLKFYLMSTNEVIGLSLENYQESGSSSPPPPNFADLVSIQAILFYQFFNTNTNAKANQKLTVLVQEFWSDIVKIKGSELVEVAISLILGKKLGLDYESILGSSMLLGVLSRVADRLSLPYFNSSKDKILQWFAQEVISSKGSVPVFVVTIMGPFFTSYLDPDIFQKTLIPVIEKMLLRSPEVMLQLLADMVPYFAFDLSNLFEQIIESVLTQLRSGNELNRKSAFNLFDSLTRKSSSCSASVLAVIKKLTESLPKCGTYEHRQNYYNALGCLINLNNSENDSMRDVSRTVVSSVTKYLSSETNENALGTLFDSIFVFFIHLDPQQKQDSSLVTPVFNHAVKVLSDDKKVVVRKSILRSLFFNVVMTPSVSHLNPVLAAIEPSLSNLIEKFQNSPLSSPITHQESYFASAVLARLYFDSSVHLTSRDKTKKLLTAVLIGTDKKPGFVFMDKVYSKISSVEEGEGFIALLELAFRNVDEISGLNELQPSPIAIAYIFAATTLTNYQTRDLAIQSLKCMASSNPKNVSDMFIPAVLYFLKHVTTSSEFKFSSNFNYRLSQIVQAISSFSSAEPVQLRKEALTKSILIAHHPLAISPMHPFDFWTSFFTTDDILPEDLVVESLDSIIEVLLGKDGVDSELSMMKKAGLNTIETCMFLAGNVVAKKLIAVLRERLDDTACRSLSEEDIGIWRTEEGTLFVDVLQSSKIKESRRQNDADSKWEADLRKELEKKGQQSSRKLTKEEQQLVNKQLAHESAVRSNIQKLHNRLMSGLDILIAMVEGDELSLEPHIPILITLIKNVALNCGKIVNEKVLDAYQALGKCLEERLRSVLKPLTVITFRNLRAANVPQEWLEASLDELNAKILFKLRYLTTSKAFSPSTFYFVYQLLDPVATRAGERLQSYEGRKHSSAEQIVIDNLLDQVTLSCDIIASHCHLGYSELVPRKDMISLLLYLLTTRTKLRKTAKDGLVKLGNAIANSVKLEEEEETLGGILSPHTIVRQACLEAIKSIPVLPDARTSFTCYVYVCRFDSDNHIVEAANRLWQSHTLSLEEDDWKAILRLATLDVAPIRSCASKSLSSFLEQFSSVVSKFLETAYHTYITKSQPPEPEYDEFGMVIARDVIDEWESRLGIAMALENAARSFSSTDIEKFFSFLIKDEALGDDNEDVREKMLQAGIAVINAHGKDNVGKILSILEKYLSTPAADSRTQDYIRESVVILLGAVAKHMDSSDSRLPSIVDKLIETLKTPSESVQYAVAECLPPLVKSIRENVPNLVKQLLSRLFTAEKYGERRGAAYGLAGIVKGRGIAALKECNIMASLKDAVESKNKDYRPRQGALFAFEALSAMLGRLFEPYIIQILPLLLLCFGDGSAEVREATQDAARVIMGKISGHCVKLILPSLLSGLEDDAWRTKRGSIELLGSMAFCAPKQLSVSLPTIIPRLSEVLTDSHMQVQQAAKQALLHFGEVITNPEIQALVPTLLLALSDPAQHTQTALNEISDTTFAHYIDAPSLALLVPILNRGLKERSTEIKKKAAQVVGNMASLTDTRDLTPYLPSLLPGLKTVLVDAVPEARATSAKALGAMISRLGEENFPTLVSELVTILKSDTTAVDRSGAAQGLSEVLSGLGVGRLEGMLPEVIANTLSPKPYIKEGFISLLVYLPTTFGGQFQPYIARIVPSILRGLADENEAVRDVALRAGQIIVQDYANSAVDLLLPELQKGLFDENWRIRHSSVQLIGDLTYRVIGVSGKGQVDTSTGEDDTIGTESGKQALIKALGIDRYNEVLAALYIVRSDSAAMVRQASLYVWKTIVSNTPRTLKEILPLMMNIVIDSLASGSYDRRQIAARVLGDLVRKLGDNVLTQIIPILEDGLDSENENTRQGVCIGLREIMVSAGKTQVAEFAPSLIPAVRKALVDPCFEVRQGAAMAFDQLQDSVGAKAIDDILPALLNELKSGGETSNNALSALREIMAVRSNVVFPVLIPTLIAPPMTSFNARALSSLISVAGAALNKRLSTILPALMDGINQSDDAVSDIQETITVLVQSINDIEGAHNLMMLLFDSVKADDVKQRIGACKVLATFCASSKIDFSNYITDWFRVLLEMFVDRDRDVVLAAWSAMDAMIKSVKKDDLDQYVAPLRRLLGGVVANMAPEQEVPGFCLPKGIAPLLSVFLQGLMYGSPDVKEQSALGIGDIIHRTDSNALKPFVVQITGPLIRIIGDRVTPQVKAGILQTLGSLLKKVSMLLKPFLPQLQRTFIKSLSDPNPTVRKQAARALSVLISLQSRLDPLVSELHSGIKSSEPSVKETMLKALYSVFSKEGVDVSESTLQTVLPTLTECLGDSEGGVRSGAAVCMGALSRLLPIEKLTPSIEFVLGQITESSMATLYCILKDNTNLFQTANKIAEVHAQLQKGLKDDRLSVCENAVLGTGKFLENNAEYDDLVLDLVNVIKDNSADVRRTALIVLKNLAKCRHEIVKPQLNIIVPVLMMFVRDKIIPVKLACERTLLYVLKLNESATVMEEFLSSADPSVAKSLTDYHRRVLSKMVQDGVESDYEQLDDKLYDESM